MGAPLGNRNAAGNHARKVIKRTTKRGEKMKQIRYTKSHHRKVDAMFNKLFRKR